MPSNDTGDVEGDPVIAIVKHGTISAYTNHRCRCPECRAAKARYDREHYPERTEETARDHLAIARSRLAIVKPGTLGV